MEVLSSSFLVSGCTSSQQLETRNLKPETSGNEIRRYNSTRLLALSISLLWHGLCDPARIMARGTITFAAFITVVVILIFPQLVSAQQSTVQPSSLSTRPLTSESTESELRGSCDLCRKSERRAGSDLRPQRRHREKGLRPHKHAKGTHRSLDQALKSTLPRRSILPPEGQERRDSQAREPAE